MLSTILISAAVSAVVAGGVCYALIWRERLRLAAIILSAVRDLETAMNASRRRPTEKPGATLH